MEDFFSQGTRIKPSGSTGLPRDTDMPRKTSVLTMRLSPRRG